MKIELLVVPDCPNEKAAGDLIATALADLHMAGVEVQTVVVRTSEEAAERRFTGSPSIFIDGWDPFLQPRAATGLACRVYVTSEGVKGVPALPDLRRALKEAADPLRSRTSYA